MAALLALLCMMFSCVFAKFPYEVSYQVWNLITEDRFFSNFQIFLNGQQMQLPWAFEI